jgi:hypothetical protein
LRVAVVNVLLFLALILAAPAPEEPDQARITLELEIPEGTWIIASCEENGQIGWGKMEGP